MILRRGSVPRESGSLEAVAALGRFESMPLSEAGGLSQFGARVETLWPGARSSDRHWHEAEDEFLYMIEGEAVLVEDDGERVVGPGDACAWKAGVANGHHLVNRSDKSCRFLIVGTRAAADRVHYSDIDKVVTRAADGTVTRARRDGSPLSEGAA
jgi:uncharacterized cupin superfamily protein